MIKLPDERRISLKRFRRRQVLRAPPPPQTAGAAKRRNAAFSRHAGAGQDDDARSGVVQLPERGDVGRRAPLGGGGRHGGKKGRGVENGRWMVFRDKVVFSLNTRY